MVQYLQWMHFESKIFNPPMLQREVDEESNIVLNKKPQFVFVYVDMAKWIVPYSCEYGCYDYSKPLGANFLPI